MGITLLLTACSGGTATSTGGDASIGSADTSTGSTITDATITSAESADTTTASTSTGAADTSSSSDATSGGSDGTSTSSESSGGAETTSEGGSSSESTGPTRECGDGVLGIGEDCDGGDLGGASCLDLGHTGGTLACQDGCTFDESACTDYVVPGFGELVITEVMQNPAAVADAAGEWFELHNPSLVEAFALDGCVVEGGGMGEGFSIDAELVIGPGEYLTFATAADPGFAPDFVWPGAFALTNTSDTVRLNCGGLLVDEISYDAGATFPNPTGASMQLDPGEIDVLANDDGGNWCEGVADYHAGDLGTPGEANASCFPVDYTIDFCRLQFPVAIDDVEGTNIDVFGRAYVAGLTDASGVGDPAVQVRGEVGVGPDGSDPAADPSWTWQQGAINPGYGPASPGYEANNDEYQATLVVPAAGSYDFAFRFTGDGGASFTYCDGQDAGSSDGYAPADAGQLTASPPPPPPVLYFSEYLEGSSNDKALEIYNASGGVADLGACQVRYFFNGGVVPTTTIGLAGAVAIDDVFVVCDDDILDATPCDLLAGGSFFNGDDAIELRCGGTVLDVIGQVGVDPGVEWLSAGVGTANEDLRRSCDVVGGDADGSDAFDPSVQWTTTASADQTDLGQYVCR